MKRLLTFLALCCLVVTGAWADGFTPSTEVSPVKYVISVDRDNMVIATDFTYSVYGASHSSKGEFAFISAGGVDTYYLYETTTRKYMKLADGAQASNPNGVVPTASKNEALTFTITPSDAEGKWWIKPTTMDTYLNFHGGWRSYTNNTNTVGFYENETDPGSLWDLTLTEAGPVQYVLTNAANMSVGIDLTYSEEGTNHSPRGRFSFISTGAADTYYLYENTFGKYVKLADGAVVSGKNGVAYADTEGDAQAFTVTPSDVEGKWWIKPTTMNTFLNFYGGVNQYKNTDKVGFYDHGNDNGSRWSLIEPLTFKSDAYFTIQCKKNSQYASYNANATADGVNHLARAASNSNNALFRIVSYGDNFNIVPAMAPDQYVYAINTNNADSNVGVGTKNAGDNDALWQIVKNGDAFNIIPRGGSNGWNCRGSVNSVNVIGQWDNNNTDDNRWYISEVDASKIVLPGEYIRLLNHNYNKYMSANGNAVNSIEDGTGVATLWYVTEDMKLMNVGTGNFLGNISQSAQVSLNATNTTTFEFEVVNTDYVAFKQTDGGNYQYGHIDGGNHLVGWETSAPATQWTLSKLEITPAEYTITVSGLAEGVTGGIVYGGQTYGNEGKLTAAPGLDGALLTATTVGGYYSPAVTVDGESISVVYESTQPKVVANMADLIEHGTNNGAVKLNSWTGTVYSFDGSSYVGGIEDSDLAKILNDKQRCFTVAAWVYGSPSAAGKCIFGYGAQNDGVMTKIGNGSVQGTYKGSADIESQAVTLEADQWNLVAYSFKPGVSCRYLIGTTNGNYYTKSDTRSMVVPAAADQKFAIGSGNQGGLRDSFNGLIGNLVVIQSADNIDNATVYSLIGEAPTTDEVATFDYGWLPGTAQADDQWTAWTCDVPEGISTQNEYCIAENLFVITKRYKLTNELNKLQVTFQHEGGNHRTEIVGVDVTADDGMVYSDYHHGYTGNAKADNVYTINDIPAGNYTVRYITTKRWANEQNTQIKGHITPVVTKSAPQVTDLANLSNDKAYVLICERGQLTTSNGQLVPVAKDREDAFTAEANMFAIIKSGDKYYLWSIAEGGYVRSDKAITDRLAAQEITLTPQEDGTFLLILNDKGVNMQNNASGIILDGWKSPDGGNKYAIYEVEDFADAETAIAAIPGWAPIVGKVYTIKAHFTGNDYTDLYLASDTSAEQLLVPMPTAATANQGYWVAEASGNTDRPWKFKSGLGYAKYLDWQNGGLSTNGDNFRLLECSNVIYNYHLNVNTDNRNIGTWADATKGFGAIGQGGCWSGNAGHNNSNWTTDYTIEEVTGVDVYTVTGTGTLAVKGIEGYTYASSIAAGGVVIVPTGTTLTEENFTVDNETKVLINSADKTIVLLPDYSSNTYYMNIENKDTGRWPFLYNDIEYTKDFTLQAQSVNASSNGFTWKVTFDENGNVTGLVNAETGKGIKHQKDNNSNLTAFNCEYASGDFYFLTFAETGDNRLNAAGSNSDGSRRAVTAWYGTENANQWRFNKVESENLEEYNVVVTQPEGCRGYALYDGKKAGNGGFFLAPADLEQSALTAVEIRGFLCDGVTLNDHTITLTYTAATLVTVNYSLYLKEGETEKLLETAAETVTEYVGQAPHQPFSVPEYVDVTYGQGVDENGLIDGEATAIKVITTYNDLMPFVPGELTTVDIDVRNHYYFHVEERTMTINDVETTLWVPCISPKEPTFEDDAAYIWRMEGDWYNGFRFHNNQIAMTDAQSGSEETAACHITFRHKEVMLDEEEQMEGMKGKTSLTEKTFKLVSDDNLSEASRATLTADASDAHSYFDLVYAAKSQDAKYQFRIHGTTNRYLNFRDYDRLKDNPDSLLCLYSNGYADQASSFTFHDGEVCTEADKLAVQAMIDAIEKGGVGALVDKNAQEYLDLLTLLERINDTTKGCTRVLFETYTNKLVNSQKEKKAPAAGEAYRLAVRTKSGHNLYLKDDGGYTTDSLKAAVYVLAQKDEDTYFLAGNNNQELTYFMNQGGTAGSYNAENCDLNYEFMNGIEADGENINATPAAMYATLCLTDANGNVATMNVSDESDPTWASNVEEPFMNDDYSSAIVMEPVKYTYNKPKLSSGTGDGHEGVWASIWLPFPMVFPDGIEVYKGTQERTVHNDPYLGLERVDTDHVVPQGGYILYSETMDPGQIQVAPMAAAVAGVRTDDDAAFIGFTEGDPTELYNTYLKDNNPYVLANKSKGIGFYKYTGTTFPMGKAIWMKPTGTDAECVKLGFEDIISAIGALHGHTEGTEIFDLQGRRLDKVEKGKINVINGQKIMFK